MHGAWRAPEQFLRGGAALCEAKKRVEETRACGCRQVAKKMQPRSKSQFPCTVEGTPKNLSKAEPRMLETKLVLSGKVD